MPEDFREYVIDQLRRAGPVETRAMFGGHGFYLAGEFFAILFKGRFYLKTSAATRERFVKLGMKPFRPNVKQRLKSYYEVPPEILESTGTLARWAREAAEQ